jgi:hypothetical protein
LVVALSHTAYWYIYRADVDHVDKLVVGKRLATYLRLAVVPGH